VEFSRKAWAFICKPRNYWLYVGFFISVGYLVLVYFFMTRFETDLTAKFADLGLNELGDMLGGGFAPLAFLWLFVATMMQSQELRLQRKEIEENREVMKEQAEAAKKQAELAGEQVKSLGGVDGLPHV
jgi:hypothetical protein